MKRKLHTGSVEILNKEEFKVSVLVNHAFEEVDDIISEELEIGTLSAQGFNNLKHILKTSSPFSNFGKEHVYSPLYRPVVQVGIVKVYSEDFIEEDIKSGEFEVTTILTGSNDTMGTYRMEGTMELPTREELAKERLD